MLQAFVVDRLGHLYRSSSRGTIAQEVECDFGHVDVMSASEMSPRYAILFVTNTIPT